MPFPRASSPEPLPKSGNPPTLYCESRVNAHTLRSRFLHDFMFLTTRRLFAAIFFLALFALTARNVTDPDFGWHLRTGEYIVTTHSVPEVDSFSFTAPGQPRLVHDWLTDAAMYLLYRIGGEGALILFFSLVGALAFGLLYLRCEGKPYIAAFVVLLAALAAAPFWGVRPQTLSLLFTSIFLYILDRYRRVGAGRFVLWLVPLTLLWANCHGSYALGLALIAIYLAGDLVESWLKWNGNSTRQSKDTMHLAGVLLLCLATIALNPHGLAFYLYPLQTLNSSAIQTYIQEWQSPDFHALAIQPFALMLVLTLGALAISRRRVGLVDMLLVAGFAYASLRSARQISIWVLVTAPVLSSAILEVLNELPLKRTALWARRPTRGIQLLNVLVLLVIAGAVLLRIWVVIGEQPRAEREYFPVVAVQQIQSQRFTGPIFNQYEWGGYLIWQLYPSEKVFIDGRSDLYGLDDDRVVQE